jgi:hypothetical protein
MRSEFHWQLELTLAIAPLGSFRVSTLPIEAPLKACQLNLRPRGNGAFSQRPAGAGCQARPASSPPPARSPSSV